MTSLDPGSSLLRLAFLSFLWSCLNVCTCVCVCQAWIAGKKYDAVGVATFGPIDPKVSSKTWGHITTTPKPNWAVRHMTHMTHKQGMTTIVTHALFMVYSACTAGSEATTVAACRA